MMYEDKVCVREDEVDGVNRWYWLEGDNGTWEGPSKEFVPLREKIFSLTNKRGTIISAGGALGMYPRLWANYFDRVYTFEPSPLSFHVLNLNCQLPNIYKFNAALSHNHEPLKLNLHCNDNVGMNNINTDAKNEEAIPVAVLRIDDFELNDVDVLQLDIENWERRALEGAAKTIERCRPVISLETVSPEIEAFLKQFGYQNRGRGGYDQVFSAT